MLTPTARSAAISLELLTNAHRGFFAAVTALTKRAIAARTGAASVDDSPSATVKIAPAQKKGVDAVNGNDVLVRVERLRVFKHGDQAGAGIAGVHVRGQAQTTLAAGTG